MVKQPQFLVFGLQPRFDLMTSWTGVGNFVPESLLFYVPVHVYVVVLVDGLGPLGLHILDDLHTDVHVGLAGAKPDVAENDLVLFKCSSL